jgi:hypothetical protein
VEWPWASTVRPDDQSPQLWHGLSKYYRWSKQHIKFSSYLTENRTLFHFKDEALNAV